MACEDGDCVVYEERDKAKYIRLLSKYIKKFVDDKLSEIAWPSDVYQLQYYKELEERCCPLLCKNQWKMN